MFTLTAFVSIVTYTYILAEQKSVSSGREKYRVKRVKWDSKVLELHLSLKVFSLSIFVLNN